MKTFFALLVIGITFISCEADGINEEISEHEIQATEQDESVNSSGGGNEESDNGED